MMGRRRRDQGKLFYEFRLEDRIPESHLLRRIDVFASEGQPQIFSYPQVRRPITPSNGTKRTNFVAALLSANDPKRTTGIRAPSLVSGPKPAMLRGEDLSA
jgi:hypothetical protein